MKALILASGLGVRLQPLTNEIPKCLVPLGKQTILSRLLTQFSNEGITEIIITTGPFEERMREAIAPFQNKLKIALVKNEVYDTTNYIFSIFRARHLLNDDILLIHGDMVFESDILQQLLNDAAENRVMVRKDHCPQKDFKARIENNRIFQISTQIQGRDCHFLAPIYYFSQRDMALWLSKIDEFVEVNNTGCYAEEALNPLLSNSIHLKPVYYQEELCMEIDDHEDLEIALKRITNGSQEQ